MSERMTEEELAQFDKRGDDAGRLARELRAERVRFKIRTDDELRRCRDVDAANARAEKAEARIAKLETAVHALLAFMEAPNVDTALARNDALAALEEK